MYFSSYYSGDTESETKTEKPIKITNLKKMSETGAPQNKLNITQRQIDLNSMTH